jgi:uncharacterized metal-binding protein
MSAAVPQCTCRCGDEAALPVLLYPCSGAADTGELTDRAARLLDAEEKAWMACLAGIGGRVSGLMANAAAAPALLAIDGCPQDCARKTLELAGFSHVQHVRVTDLGFKKGQTPVTDETIRCVAAAATALLKN